MSAEILLQIFNALSSTNPDETNAANQKLMEILSTDPVNCIDSAAQIVNSDGLTVTLYSRSLSLIKNILKPTSQKNFKQIQKIWMSFPEQKRTEIKQSIFRCLMIDNVPLQDSAAVTIAVIANLERSIPDASHYFNFLNELFIKPEEYGEESKYGALSAMNEILLFNDSFFITLGSDHLQNDLSIALQITSAVLESEEIKLEIRSKALTLLLTCANGYGKRGLDIFEDDATAEHFFTAIIQNFGIEDEKFHDQLYDLLYILFKSKYVEIENMFYN